MAHTRAALAIATVLAVGVAPAVLGGTATAAVPLTAGAATASTTGTVVQEGGPLVVPSGEEVVTTRVTVTLPADASGPVKARLLLPITYEFAGDAWNFQDDIKATCSVNGGAYQPCPWLQPVEGVNQGPYVATMPVTEAATTLTYDIRIESGIGARRHGDVNGTLEVGAGGAPDLASGPVVFQFARNTPAANLRTTVLARDKAGVLWQYESTGLHEKPLKARERIGGGWNIYTSITPLGARTAAGEGSIVARDRDGVLWHYQGSGNPDAPFKPRVRVGGGWNTYTAIATRGGGLMARDREGLVWYYPQTWDGSPSAPLQPPRLATDGWNVYSAIVGQGQSPGYGVVARDMAGVLWSHETSRNGSGLPPRERLGGGWNAYDRIAYARNLAGSRYGDYLARDKEGRLWFYEGLTRSGNLVPSPTRRQIGWGWDIYDAIL
ncbi:hypothetical protein ABZ567_05660 [Streptomyces sp. NPDC016459]|uniref:hypothetical protein n=1 Tax=Streptomyces sp. NPDC016459 TaxID=3157190 RepID=UPI0033F66666